VFFINESAMAVSMWWLHVRSDEQWWALYFIERWCQKYSIL